MITKLLKTDDKSKILKAARGDLLPTEKQI